MNQGVENLLWIAADCGGDIFCAFSVGSQVPTDFIEHVEELGCRGFTGFDTRLVVSVDVYKRGIKGYGPLKEGDEVPKGSRCDFFD